MSACKAKDERDIGDETVAHPEDGGPGPTALKVAVVVVVRLQVGLRSVPTAIAAASGTEHGSGGVLRSIHASGRRLGDLFGVFHLVEA
jgi:hypothetical protein